MPTVKKNDAADRRVISILVDNQRGVLARVSSLFNRRGFNIDSLTVSTTNDPSISRITVTTHGDENSISQLLLQTDRLEVTRQIFELDQDNSLQRELLLLKVKADVKNRAELREIASIYKSKIIDLSPDSMVFELTASPARLTPSWSCSRITTFWKCAAPASPPSSAAACTSTCRNPNRKSARSTIPPTVPAGPGLSICPSRPPDRFPASRR